MKTLFLLAALLLILAIQTTFVSASGESSGETCKSSGSKECDSKEWDDDDDSDSDETCDGDDKKCVKDEDVDKVKDSRKRDWVRNTRTELNKQCGRNGRGRKAFKNAGKYCRGMSKRRGTRGIKRGRKNRRRLWTNVKGSRKHFARMCADANVTLNIMVKVWSESYDAPAQESNGTSSGGDCGCGQTGTYGETEEQAPDASTVESRRMMVTIRRIMVNRATYMRQGLDAVDFQDTEETNEVYIQVYRSYLRVSVELLLAQAYLINEYTTFDSLTVIFFGFQSQISFIATQLTYLASTIYTEPLLINNDTETRQELQEEVTNGDRELPAICQPDNADGVDMVMTGMTTNIAGSIVNAERFVTSTVTTDEENFLNELYTSTNETENQTRIECDEMNQMMTTELTEICNQPKYQNQYGRYICDNYVGSFRNIRETYFIAANNFVTYSIQVSTSIFLYFQKTSDAWQQWVYIKQYVTLYLQQEIFEIYVFNGGSTMEVDERRTKCVSNMITEMRTARKETYTGCSECAKNNLGSSIWSGCKECLKGFKDRYRQLLDRLNSAQTIGQAESDEFLNGYTRVNFDYTSGGGCPNQVYNNYVNANTNINNCKLSKVQDGGNKVKEAKDKCKSCRA